MSQYTVGHDATSRRTLRVFAAASFLNDFGSDVI